MGFPLAPVSPGSGALTSWLVTSPALCVCDYSPPDLKALKEAPAQRQHMGRADPLPRAVGT